MPVTIVATVGSATANSTVTLAEALSYFDRVKQPAAAAAFVDADSDDQKRLLIAACARLEEEEGRVHGTRVDETQALSWPRMYPYADCEASYVKTSVMNGSAIPQEWKDAQCDLALAIAVLGSDPNGRNAQASYKEIEVPGVRLVMRDDLPTFNDELPPSVWRKIARYLKGSGGLELVRC